MARDDEDEGADGGADGDKSGRGRVARIMARALWQAEWSAANPEADGEARRAAWKAIPEEARTERVKLARRALRLMAKRGVTVTAPPGGGPEDEGDAD